MADISYSISVRVSKDNLDNTVNVSGYFVASGTGARLFVGNGTLNTSGTSTVDFSTVGGSMGISLGGTMGCTAVSLGGSGGSLGGSMGGPWWLGR